MKCNLCGAMLPDDAHFCHRCGERTGTVRENPAGVSPMESADDLQKNASKSISMPENTAAKEEVVCEKAKQKKFVLPLKKPTKKCLHTAGTGILMLGVFFAFIFVFLIGFNVSLDGTIAESDDSAALLLSHFRAYQYHIFEFFGPQYSLLFASAEGFSQTMIVPLVVCMLHTLISAATLVAVVVCSLLAGIRYAKSFHENDGNAKSITVPAFIAILSYMAGSAALFSLSAFSENIYSPSVELSMHFQYNGATVAGTVLTALCMAAYLVLFVLSREECARNKRTILKNCLRAAKFAVLLAAVFLVCGAPLAIRGTGEQSVAGTLSLVSAISVINNLCGMDFSLPYSAAATFSCAAGAVMQYGLFALLLIALISFIKGVHGKQEKKPLPFAIALSAVAAAAMVMCFVAGTFLCKFYTASAASMQYQTEAGTLITVFILTVVSLVLTVADGIAEERAQKERELPATAEADAD